MKLPQLIPGETYIVQHRKSEFSYACRKVKRIFKGIQKIDRVTYLIFSTQLKKGKEGSDPVRIPKKLIVNIEKAEAK